MVARKPIAKGFVFRWPGVPTTLTAVEASRLVVSGKAGKKKDKVRVKCSCGRAKSVRDVWVYNLRSVPPHTTSCGCENIRLSRERAEKPVHKGERIHGTRLTAVEDSELREEVNGKQVSWVMCACSCDSVKQPKWYRVNNVRRLITRSCGCLRREVMQLLKRKPVKKGHEFPGTYLVASCDSWVEDQKTLVRCRCTMCGKVRRKPYHVAQIRSLNTRSCVCLKKETSSLTGIRLARENHNLRHRWLYKAPEGSARENLWMKSSWELAVADWLDREAVEWLYEPRDVLLKTGCRFLPDFYLPETDKWIEVKGNRTAAFIRKKRLFLQRGYELLVIDQQNLEDLTGVRPRKSAALYEERKFSARGLGQKRSSLKGGVLVAN